MPNLLLFGNASPTESPTAGMATMSAPTPAPIVTALADTVTIPGLEDVLYFNGVYLHRRVAGGVKQDELFRVTAIDGISDADIRDDRDVNPGAHGETAFNAFYGGRTITIEGYIEALNVTRLRDMQVELRGAFNALVESQLTFTAEGRESVYINCRKSVPIAMREEQNSNLPRRNFLITLRASDPRFYATPETTATTEPNEVSLRARIYERTYPLMYTYTIDEEHDIVEELPPSNYIQNIGNFPTNPVLRIYGPCTNPSVSNITTGEAMYLSYTMTSDTEYIEIDTARRTIVDQLGINKFAALSPLSDWLSLDPGDNDVRFSVRSFSIGSNLVVTAHSAWL